MSMLIFLILSLANVISCGGLSQDEKNLALSVRPTETANCNAAGSSWTYSETIDRRRKTRKVQTNTCPNHYSACQLGTCAGDRLSHAKRQPVDENVYTLPAFPSFVKAASVVDATCSEAPVAIALNGVPIYGMADPDATPTCVSFSAYDAMYPRVGIKDLKRCDLDGVLDGVQYCGDALRANGAQMDKCGGYTDGAGQYRYHGPPICLIQQLEDERLAREGLPQTTMATTVDGVDVTVTPMFADKHGVQIAWALDGFPVYYGAKGPKSTVMQTCGSPGAHSKYCLDECNGFEGVLPGVDDYNYRYYVTGDLPTGECSSNTDGLGITNSCARVDDKCCLSSVPSTAARPYTIGCFKGCRAGDLECAYDDSKEGTTPAFMLSDVTALPSGPFFEVSGAEGAAQSGSPAGASPSSPGNAGVSVQLPLATGVDRIAYRFLHNRTLGLIATDGSVESLAGSPSDAFISSLAIDRALIDSSLSQTDVYFTTQYEIMKVSGAKAPGAESLVPPSPVISGIVYVNIHGHNFGREGMNGGDVTVTVQGEKCYSLVRHSSSEVRCVVLTLRPPYTITEADVYLVGLGDPVQGPTAHSALAAMSGRSVIDHVDLVMVEFIPYAVALSPDQSPSTGWLYWSQLSTTNPEHAGVFRAHRTTEEFERVVSYSYPQVSSLAVYRPDPEGSVAAALSAMVLDSASSEVVFFADERTACVSFTVVSTYTRGCGRSCINVVYPLLVGASGVVAVALDHFPQEHARLLVTLRDGEVLSIDLNFAIPAAVGDAGMPLDASVDRTGWPSYLERLVSLSSQSRLGGITAVAGPNPSADASRVHPKAWSFQRIFAADVNLQRIYAVSETGFPLLPMDVGTDHDSSRLVWPFQVGAVWTPPSDLPGVGKQYVSLFVAEYLGRIWRYELQLDDVTGKIDREAYLTTRPTLVADLSEFGAGQALRASIGANVAAGFLAPSTFFEAYG